MKQKLGIFTTLILTLVIAGSTFAASVQTTPAKNNMVATKKATKMKKAKKHKKHHKAMKSAAKKAAAAPASK